jgi:hypothetical protein
VLVDWSRPDENADVASAFDRKKKGKLTAAEWVVEYLRNAGIVPKRKVIADGAAAGYSESAIEAAQQRSKGRICSNRMDIKAGRCGGSTPAGQRVCSCSSVATWAVMLEAYHLARSSKL